MDVYSSEPQQQHIDLRDSAKSDYYEQEHDESENIDRDVGKSLARVAARTSSNNSPSPISDVYFIGKLHLMFGFLVNIFMTIFAIISLCTKPRCTSQA